MKARLFFLVPGTTQFVRQSPNTKIKPQYTVKTVMHDGASNMIWGCFSYYGVGSIYRIILQEVVSTYAEEEIPLKWVLNKTVAPNTPVSKQRLGSRPT